MSLLILIYFHFILIDFNCTLESMLYYIQPFQNSIPYNTLLAPFGARLELYKHFIILYKERKRKYKI